MSTPSFIDEKAEPVASFNIRVANDVADFASLWPRTNNCGAAHCYAFQCADILEVWSDTIGKARGTQGLLVAVFDEIGRPVLLLPFGIEQDRGIRVLRFLDGGVCDYNAPVLFEPKRMWDRETLTRLWRQLITTLPGFDLAIFDKMPAEICGVANPLVKLFGTPSSPSGYFLNISQDWDEYAAEHLPYKRESLAQRRRLSRLGQVAFTVAETEADRQRILEAMIRQKSCRYLETRGVDGLDRPGYREYYPALINRLPWPGPMLVSALEVDGAIVATNWGFIANKRFIGVVTSFESGEWRRLSPGKLLLEDLLKWNFANGSTVFDFGSGDEPYKKQYCDQTLLLYQATITVTAVGKAYRVAQHIMAWRVLQGMHRRARKMVAVFTGWRSWRQPPAQETND